MQLNIPKYTPRQTQSVGAVLPPRVCIVFVVLYVFAWVPGQSVAQEMDSYGQAASAFDRGEYALVDSLISSQQAAGPLSVDWILLRAKTHVQNQRYDTAISSFLIILETEPGHPEAVFGLKRLGYTDEESPAHDTAFLSSRAQAEPDNLMLKLQYAESLAADGNYKAAIDEYQAYLDQTTATPNIVTDILVTISEAGGPHALGEEIAQDYLKIYPASDDLYMRLGYFQLWQGKFTAATASFEKAVELNSNNTDASTGLAQVDEESRQRQVAAARVSELVKAVDDDPENAGKRLALIDHLLANGQLFDASQHLQYVETRLSGQEGVTTQLAARQSRLQHGALGTASSGTDRIFLALREDSGNTEMRYALVDALLNSERFYEAYDQLLALPDSLQDTDSWFARFQRADSGLLQNQGYSSIYGVDRLQRLLKRDPENLELRYALVDSLLIGDRFAEAMDVLTKIPDLTDEDLLDDLGYQGRLNTIAVGHLDFAERRIEELKSEIQTGAGAELTELKRELIDHLLLLGEKQRAASIFEELIEANVRDVDLRLDWIQFLRETGELISARDEIRNLFDSASTRIDVQKEYVLAHIRTEVDSTAQRLIDEFIADSSAGDAGFLLELTNHFIDRADTTQAQALLDRIQVVDETSLKARLESVEQLLDRQKVRIAESVILEKLNEARKFAHDGQLDIAISRYGEYFSSKVTVLRDDLREFAQIHIADSNFVAARDTLMSLQKQLFSYDIARDIAQSHLAMEDYSKAVELLDSLASLNPMDFESNLNLANALKESGIAQEAQTLLGAASARLDGSNLLSERVDALASDVRDKLISQGQWTGYDFAGILIPTAYSVNASGGGTEYDRQTQGIRAEVTLPWHSVFTVGFNSHFISGSRRLVPEAETVKSKVNQIYASAMLDLTPRIRSEKSSYTNRLFAEVGLYDYEGTRSVSYFNVRYWKQIPGVMIGSVGLRTDEGAIDLWSAGGAEFNLRLTQFDARASYAGALPDSLLRLGGKLMVNVVSDNLGLPAGSADRNIGTDLMLEAGYKVFGHTYAGIAYHRVNFESRTDTYFSPDQWELTELFLEYEREAFTKWYVRFRGSIGAVSRSSGQMSERLEADVIRRLTDRLSITLRSTYGETSRALGGAASSLFSKYDTFQLTGSLYWTL